MTSLYSSWWFSKEGSFQWSYFQLCLATKFFSGSPTPAKPPPREEGEMGNNRKRVGSPSAPGHQHLEENSSADGHPQIC